MKITDFIMPVMIVVLMYGLYSQKQVYEYRLSQHKSNYDTRLAKIESHYEQMWLGAITEAKARLKISQDGLDASNKSLELVNKLVPKFKERDSLLAACQKENKQIFWFINQKNKEVVKKIKQTYRAIETALNQKKPVLKEIKRLEAQAMKLQGKSDGFLQSMEYTLAKK